ncbi:MAG: hypothetical protein ACTSUV_00315 [Candidatus Ranarchaeia archaeon]
MGARRNNRRASRVTIGQGSSFRPGPRPPYTEWGMHFHPLPWVVSTRSFLITSRAW